MNTQKKIALAATLLVICFALLTRDTVAQNADPSPPQRLSAAQQTNYLDELQDVIDLSGQSSLYTDDNHISFNKPFLQKLVLREAKITGACESFANLHVPRLLWLDLSDTIVDDSAISTINKLTTLEVLVLNGTKISNAGLDQLNLPGIRRLFLAQTSVSNMGFVGLHRSTPVLQWLDLQGTEMTTNGVVHLKTLTTLQVLILRQTKIGAAGFALLRFPLLKRLDLTDTKVADPALKTMELPAIERLFLRRTAVTDVGLAASNRLSNLRLLDLSQSRVSDIGLTQLNLPALRRLDVSGTKVTDAGV